jgi:hypothetical protein
VTGFQRNDEERFFWRWRDRLPSPFTLANLRAGCTLDLAFRQIEFSDTRCFDRPRPTCPNSDAKGLLPAAPHSALRRHTHRATRHRAHRPPDDVAPRSPLRRACDASKPDSNLHRAVRRIGWAWRARKSE